MEIVIIRFGFVNYKFGNCYSRVVVALTVIAVSVYCIRPGRRQPVHRGVCVGCPLLIRVRFAQ